MRALMLVIPGDEFAPTDTMAADTDAWVAEAEKRGMRVVGDIVLGASESKTVSVISGSPRVIDGVQASSAVAGFDVLEGESLDDVLELVAKHPMAALGTIEVRPFWEQ